MNIWDQMEPGETGTTLLMCFCKILETWQNPTGAAWGAVTMSITNQCSWWFKGLVLALIYLTQTLILHGSVHTGGCADWISCQSWGIETVFKKLNILFPVYLSLYTEHCSNYASKNKNVFQRLSYILELHLLFNP